MNQPNLAAAIFALGFAAVLSVSGCAATDRTLGQAAPAAVFAAGSVLAPAPVQERAEVQVHVISEAGSIPAVAGCRKCGQHQQWEWERLQHWRDWESWQQDWRAWAQGPEFKAAARRDALECLRRILPDADESALESAMENAANCVQCPQICRHSSRDDSSDKSGRNFLLRSNRDREFYIPVHPLTPFSPAQPDGGTNP